MGVLSGILLPHIGDITGGKVGSFFGGSKGGQIGSQIGRDLAGVASTLMPFKNGGRVPGKKGKAIKAVVHGGEYILPASVKPTKAQKMAVAKLHKKPKAKKSKKM